MGAKQELLTEAETAYSELRQAVDGIPDARMTDKWLGTWGAREIVIHISGWHREMIPPGPIGDGRSPTPTGVLHDSTRGTRVSSMPTRREGGRRDGGAQRSHRDFVAAAADLGDEQLAPGGTARDLVAGVSAQHYREHAEQIRAWRAAQQL